MDNLNTRLNDVIRRLGLTQKKLADEIGTSQSAISAIAQGARPMTEGFACRIENAYGVNAHWLLTGEGEMLKGKQEMPLFSSGKDRAVISYENGVPYYDEDFVLGFNELGFPASENPQFLVQMPKYSNATLWCNATGHSMEPEINSGDVIALKLIEDSSFLLTGDLYAIVTTNGLRTIKRLGKGRDDNHYRLIPTNKDYEEQEIPKKMILKVYKVLGNLHSF